MTDNEIIKALECCLKGCNAEGCDDCPLYKKVEDCEIEIPIIALELINRQKTKIDRLKSENLALSQKRITMVERIDIVNNARNKAIREFAERLKSKMRLVEANNYVFAVPAEKINEIVKEMTKEKIKNE